MYCPGRPLDSLEAQLKVSSAATCSWPAALQFDLNYTQHVNKTFAPRIKTAANEVRAAGLPLVGAALGVLGAGAKALYGGKQTFAVQSHDHCCANQQG